jgi:membrane-associated phospholipid phosphatase
MDISYLLYLQNLRDTTNHIFDKFFLYVTGYGEMVCLLPLFALIYWCINKKTGEFMFLSLAFARLINGFVKIFACIYRPWIKAPGVILPLGNGLKTATGYSFPSGHTTNAAATFGSFAVKQDNESKFLKILLWCLAILVGFSRNYIGVHTPQDVVVGFILAVVAIFGTIKVYNFIEKDKNAYIKVAVSGLIISLLIVVFALNKRYPINFRNDDNSITVTSYIKTSELTKDIEKKAIVNPNDMVLDLYKNIGYIVGIFLGWLIERKFVGFTTDGTTNQKILRYLVCFVLMQIMLQVICPLIKGMGAKVYTEPAISFLKTFYILGIAPFIIKFMQRKQLQN